MRAIAFILCMAATSATALAGQRAPVLPKSFSEASAQGDFEGALQALDPLILACGKGATPAPDCAVLLSTAAHTAGTAGHAIRAVELARDAIEFAARSGSDERLADAYIAYANGLRTVARYEEAGAFYRRALDLYRAKGIGSRYDRAMAGHLLAGTLIDQGNYMEAKAPLLDALLVLERGETPVERYLEALILYSAGVVLRKQDQLAEAEGVFKRSASLYLAVGSVDATGIALCQIQLGEIARRTGRAARAEAYFRSAVPALARRLPQNHASRIQADRLFALTLSDLSGRSPDAYAYLERARRAAISRVHEWRDFRSEAQADLRYFRPIFTDKVRQSWRLSDTPAR